MRTLFALMIAVGALAAVPGLLALDPAPRQQAVGVLAEHVQDLNLTDEQEAKIMDIREEYHPKIAKAMEGLRGLLTDDQRKAREQALMSGKKRMELVAALNLTGGQKEKAEAIGKEVRGLIHQEMEKIHDVLNEGQQTKLQELKEERNEHVRDRMAHRIVNFKALDLSSDQMSKLESIRKEFRPKVHGAGNKLRATVREEVRAIVSVLKA